MMHLNAHYTIFRDFFGVVSVYFTKERMSTQQREHECVHTIKKKDAINSKRYKLRNV